MASGLWGLSRRRQQIGRTAAVIALLTISGLCATLLFPPPPALADHTPQAPQELVYPVTFATSGQNVWGPGAGDAPTSNTYTFFSETWNESDTERDIRTFAGLDFGGSIGGFTNGEISLGAKFKGFTGGGLSVNYPVDISLKVPPVDSFRPGERISIGTGALVKPGASMTVAPSSGDIELVGTFAFGAGANAEVCFLDCSGNIPIVPKIEIPRQSGKILALTELQEICDFAGTAVPGSGTLQEIYPSQGCEINEQMAWAGNLPFTGKLGLPSVTMATTLLPDGKTLRGYGTHADFINLDVDLTGVLTSITGGGLGIAIPPLIPGVSAQATAFESTANLRISQSHEVLFSPTITGTLVLPPTAPEVQWSIVNPAGAAVATGKGRTITFDVGNTVQIDVPSTLQPGDVLNLTPSFAMKDTNHFTNNVSTTFATDLNSEALTVSVGTPSFEVTPSFVLVPEVCVPLVGCTDEVRVPALVAPSINVQLGPVWENTEPVYSGTDSSLFDGNRPPWQLAGFSGTTGAGFVLNPQYKPVVAIAGPGARKEGEQGTWNFTFSDADNDPLTWRLEWGDGAVETGTGNPAGTSFARSHTYADNGTYQVRLTIDDGHQPGIATHAVAVANVAPTMAAPALNATVNEHGVVTLSGTFADPGIRDSFTVAIDWGGPSGQKEQGDTIALPAGSTSFSRTHQYRDDNKTSTPSDIYTVTVTVTDKDGGRDARSVSTTVINVAPTVFAGSDRTIDEGSTTRLGVELFGKNLIQGGTAEQGTADWTGLSGGFATKRYLESVPVTTPLSFPQDYPPSAWTISSDRPSTTSVTQADSCNTYSYNQTGVQNGFTGTWIYSATALKSGTLTFNWRHTGLHSWYRTEAGATVWADGPTGRQSIPLWYQVGVSGGFDTGVQAASITLHEGYAYGFQLSGLHFDSSYILSGNLRVCTEPVYTPGQALTTPGPTVRGGSYFSGSSTQTAQGTQTVFLNSVASLVDTGGVTFDMSGYLGGSLAIPDSAQLSATFRNGSGAVIGTQTMGPVTSADRSNASQLAQRHLTGAVPVGTRIIDLTLTLTNADGGSNEAAAENLAFYLLPAPGSKLTAGFTDPGLLDTHTASIDWGDFSVPEAPVITGLPGNRTMDLSHGYKDNGTYLVTATVTDDDTGTHQHSFATVVRNVPPAVTPVEQVFLLGKPETKLLGSFTDPGALDTHTVSIDWGDNTAASPGTVTETLGVVPGTLTRGTVTGSHTYNLAGPYPRIVTAVVTVTDKDGGATSIPVKITVTDLVIPNTTMSASPTALTEGSTASFTGSFGAIVFPPGASTFTPTYNYIFDPGDGTAPTTGPATPGSTISRSHTYARNGTFVATLRFQAFDGTRLATYDTLSRVIVVNNAAPVVAAIANPATKPEGQTIAFSTSFTDLGLQDTHTATVNWGDGSAAEVLGLTPGTGGATSIGASHAYAQDGTYTATVTVTDSDGAATSRTFTVSISNVAPTVTPGANPAATEGAPVTASATFADPGPADTHTATIQWGDGQTESVPVDQAAKKLTASHLYANSGTYTVTICVRDDDTETCQSQSATVANAPPVVGNVANQASNEGDEVAVTTTFTDAGLNDTHTALINWGDGTTSPAAVSPSARAVSGSHIYAQNGIYTATITVTDQDHAAQGSGQGSRAFQVAVANVSPTVAAGADRTVNEGSAVALAPATFQDPGSADTHTATIDWGDGTNVPGVVDDGTVAGSRTYRDEGVYVVKVCVKDDGSPVCDSFTVSVLNVAPAVAAGPDQTIDEGTPLAVNASVSDPGALDAVTTTIAWGDGAQSTGPSATHMYANNGRYDVIVCADDGDGGVSCDDLVAVVANVAPAVSAGNDSSASEGDTVALNATFTDPGPADTHTATIDWGDGSASQGSVNAAAKQVSGSHQYADNGAYTVTVCVSDSDRGKGCDSLTVTVANVAPAVNAGADRLVYQGSTVGLNPASFTDPGRLDAHTATVNWGDGTTTAAAINAQAQMVVGTHVYRNVGTYQAEVCVTDKDGVAACDIMQVKVQNVAPRVFAGPDAQVDEGEAFVAAGPFEATVYATGFDGTAADGVWSSTGVTASPNGERFLGRFGSEAALLSLDNLPAHDQVTISFDLYLLDSWDGNGTVGWGPDLFEFGVAGGETLLRTTFSTQEVQMQSYPGAYPGASNPAATGAAQVGGLGYGTSNTYRLTFTVPHTDSAIAFRFLGSNLQSLGDESWGIDNVKVTVPATAPLFADPGTEGWTATVNYGDGTGAQPLMLHPDRTFALGHVYADNGTYTVTVTVTDGHGAAGSDTLTVTVGNVAPTLEAGADQTVAEGATISLAPATFNDLGTLDTHTATVDWGDGTGVQQATVTETPFGPPGATVGANGTVAASHVYADNGTYTVTVCVTDDEGATTCDTTTVTVTNVAPTVDAGADQTVAEGATISLAPASFNDLGTLDTHTATVDWGDGTGVQQATVTETPFGPPGATIGANGTVAASHVYADNGTYTVTVCVTDDEGATTCDTTTVTVTNVAPTVNAGADQTVAEGATISLAPSTFNDLGTLDTHTATVDWGDGTGVQQATVTETPFGPPGATSGANGTVAASHVYADNGTYTVTVCVTDDEGATTCDTTTVTVTNVAPTVNAGADQTVAEGATISLAPSTFNDLGTLDTHTATVDWGDGTGVQPATVTETPFGPPGATVGANGTVAASHVYADNGTHTVSVCVTDDEGATTCDTTTVIVTNVAPTVDAGADQTVAEGATISLAPATFNDLGTLDTHTATVDWGDGTGVQQATVTETPFGPPGSTAGQNGTVAASHVYADNGTYTVTVCVTDDEGATTCDTTTVTVTNVAPTVNAGADQTVAEGATITLAPSTFNDLGTLDTHTATVDWGDGTGVQQATVTETPFGPPGATSGANGTVAASHVYADNGTYTVTVCVTDDEGATTCDTTTVIVTNVAPTVNAGADQTVAEGATISLAPSTFNDLGTLDTHTATVDWGDGTGVQQATVTETPFGPPGATSGANGTVAASHVYADNGTYTVTVCVTDDEGATTCDTTTVTVTNVAPTVNAGPDLSMFSGQTLTVSAAFTDPSVVDTHTATIDWADGSPLQPVNVDQGAGSGSLGATHRYTVPGLYTVTVCVTDDDGGTGCDTLTLEVKVLQVQIQIQQQPINLKSKGTVPVAVLSGTYEGVVFDATTIVRSTLRFAGATATDAGGKSAPDLNNDRLPDMLYHFRSEELTLASNSTQACVTGVTESGIHFTACGPIRIVGSSKP